MSCSMDSVGGIVSVDAVSLLKRDQFALSSSHLGEGDVMNLAIRDIGNDNWEMIDFPQVGMGFPQDGGSEGSRA